MLTVILAGGFGTRISEETEFRPKPMVEIGGKPILWHIMKTYSVFGINEFVVCCGYKGYMIKEYFANYFLHMSDVTFDLERNQIEVHRRMAEPWRVTLVDTGESTMTGGRLKRIREYLKPEECFCFTYGDGLGNVDISALIAFHHQHGKLATVTAVKPPGRFGALELTGNQVTGFLEKPRGDGGLINGGYFVLSRKCLDLIEGDATSWELSPMNRLAEMGELMAFEHRGFWQPMDTLRDKNHLEETLVDGRSALEGVDMSEAAGPHPTFWAGRHVVVTGHTGFKGAWLTIWLHQLGARVTGISLPPVEPSLFSLARVSDISESHFVDLRDGASLDATFRSAGAEIVFHLAAQSLVLKGYQEPLPTFTTNVMGTANLLEVLRSSRGTKVAVVATTDKVYRDQGGEPHQETDPLGGHDSYSASKAAAEIVIDSYRRSFLAERGIALASARAGNVIGGGDWAQDRLIPDAVRAWSKGRVLHVRRPNAVRSWQHVLEPLAGYLALAERVTSEPSLAGPFNFGPNPDLAASVKNLVHIARAVFGKGEVAWGDNDNGGPFEAPLLTLDNEQARARLGICPRWDLSYSVTRTMSWYRLTAAGHDARAACLDDLAAFETTNRVSA